MVNDLPFLPTELANSLIIILKERSPQFIKHGGSPFAVVIPATSVLALEGHGVRGAWSPGATGGIVTPKNTHLTPPFSTVRAKSTQINHNRRFSTPVCPRRFQIWSVYRGFHRAGLRHGFPINPPGGSGQTHRTVPKNPDNPIRLGTVDSHFLRSHHLGFPDVHSRLTGKAGVCILPGTTGKVGADLGSIISTLLMCRGVNEQFGRNFFIFLRLPKTGDYDT